MHCKCKLIIGIAAAFTMGYGATSSLAATSQEDVHKPAYSQSERSRLNYKDRHGTKKESHGKHGAKWGYSGSIGPAHWGNLSDQYILCKTGKTQSPIDFQKTFQAGRTDLDLDYHVTELELENNGHTIRYPIRRAAICVWPVRSTSCSSFTTMHPANTRKAAATTKWRFTSCIRLPMEHWV